MKETKDVLENLRDICRDAQKGFQEASGLIKNPQIREFFTQQSTERGRFANELDSLAVRDFAGEPKKDGTVGGSLHRAWIDMKAKVTDDHGILSSVEAGEDAAKKAYEEALAQNLPAEIQSTIRSQAQSVFSA